MKFYTVWIGLVPGVYDNWSEAEAQVKNFKGSKYKSFKSQSEAEDAYTKSWQDYYPAPTSRPSASAQTSAPHAHAPVLVEDTDKTSVPFLDGSENVIVEDNYGLAPGEVPW